MFGYYYFWRIKYFLFYKFYLDFKFNDFFFFFEKEKKIKISKINNLRYYIIFVDYNFLWLLIFIIKSG